ncbi:DUF1232 domain-containing protein [Coleofasciculus sp. FACHB-542]|nr:DUF1232 domain-containing protein [Coleofasciculus sp. FACHB-542]
MSQRLHPTSTPLLLMTPPNFWESLTKTATNLGEAVGNTASQATQAAAETATGFGGVVSSAVSQASKAVTETAMAVGKTTRKPVSLPQTSEDDRLAFYGALFAVAAADGSIDPEELNLILNTPDLDNMSESAKRQVQSYAINPPTLEDSLKKLSKADDTLRFGLMFYILNLVWVDKVLNPGEAKAIKLAQAELKITDEQVQAIQAFVQKMGEIRERGLNDDYAVNAMKEATSVLVKAGIPVTPFSSSETANTQTSFETTYSDDLFWEKLGNFAVQAGKNVVENALILFYAAEHPNTPTNQKLIVYGALAYLILPVDAVPDFLPAVGFGDDIGSLTTALGMIVWNINSEVKEAAKQKMQEWFAKD